MLWPPTRGDNSAQLERFTFGSGITGSNSYRGMFFGKITATAVELYKSPAMAATDKMLSGNHGQTLSTSATTFAIVTLTAANTSGIGDTTCYLCGKEADSTFEVWPSFLTDTELAVVQPDYSRWLGSATSFWSQHKRIAEEFVRLMRQRIPPVYNADSGVGTRRGDASVPWRVNSIGDQELVGLHNLDDYRAWAEHATLGMIFRITRTIPDDTQLQLIEGEDALASAAWSSTIPQFDADYDLDADREGKRFRVSRG